MPVYEYRCISCDATFEARRTMAEAEAEVAVTCPAGHAEVRRVFSVFAAAGRASQPAAACCGGGCGCR